MNKKITIGIDASLRSCAIIARTDDDFIDFLLIQIKKSNKEHEYEKLLINITHDIKEYIEKYNVDCLFLEGISMNSKSSLRDVIDALHWNIRQLLVQLDIKFYIIPPQQWKKHHNINHDKKKIKELKDEYGKDFWKILSYNKLPQSFKDRIENMKCGKYDLADAYWLASYKI